MKPLALLLATAALVFAQSVPISVTETAGIRRTAFPTSARVHLPQGALTDAVNARVVQNGKEVPAQIGAESKFADGSIEWLDVDFNPSIGPLEKSTFTLEYGPGVTRAEPRGLSVVSDADTITIGSIRFNRNASPLIASVKYRGEDIGKGPNGLFATDASGKRFEPEAVKAEVFRTGPLVAAIRYTGTIASVPFTLTATMPSSKTAVRLNASVDDPGNRIRELIIETPLSFATLPIEWDFGTSRWTYGVLRAPTDSVILTQDLAGWRVNTNNQLYETSNSTERIHWGHLQDGKEVVALAWEAPAGGAWRTRIDGNGQFSVTAAGHQLSVIEHFVNSPVQIGAATSPAALLSPLLVEVGR